MHITSERVKGGIRAQFFTVADVPGVLWTPAGSSGPRPLVLIGHGGGGNKTDHTVVSRAFPYVASCGFAAAAIDVPGCGDRPQDPEINRLVALIQEREAAGEPAGSAWPAFIEIVAAQLIPDWQATLDALRQLECVSDSQPVGYYGLSLGGQMGMRLVGAEPRITAAVLGLTEGDRLTAIAARITIPVEFVMQWDDEGHPRDAMLKLFDALGSAEKTLHANPGPHRAVPSFEIDSSVRFFARHLGSPGTGTTDTGDALTSGYSAYLLAAEMARVPVFCTRAEAEEEPVITVLVPMTVEQDEDGWWRAHAQLGPSVGANGQGRTRKEALDDLREALPGLV